MTIEQKFDLIFQVGSAVCTSFTGFSKSEMIYCKNKYNWGTIRQFLMSDSPYEAIINLDLHPISNLMDYFQLLMGSLLTFADEENNNRLDNIIMIIDNMDMLDMVVTHTKLLKAMLALVHAGTSYNQFNIKSNCRKVLAHVFKKFPKLLESNAVRSRNSRKFRFT